MINSITITIGGLTKEQVAELASNNGWNSQISVRDLEGNYNLVDNSESAMEYLNRVMFDRLNKAVTDLNSKQAKIILDKAQATFDQAQADAQPNVQLVINS